MFLKSVSKSQTFLLLDEQRKESRIKYLNLNDQKQKTTEQRNMKIFSKNSKNISSDEPVAIERSTAIEAKEISASWLGKAVNNEENNNNLSLSGLNFIARQGELLMIVGRVGSGKSSILMALLGELPIVSGHLVLTGTISYASQEAWIFSATLRDNILFGKEYNEKKFEEVLRVCALVEDIKLLPEGDETLVGERGVCLSGGQKARVNLARALYFEADIYLLDDPLSAVDASVARHIFENCIETYLKDKTVVLATHQLQFIHAASNILIVESGCQVALGTYKELNGKLDTIGLNRLTNEKEKVSTASIENEENFKIARNLDLAKDIKENNSSVASVSMKVAKNIKIGEPVKRKIAKESIDDGIDKEQYAGIYNSPYLFYLICVSSITLLLVVFVSTVATQMILNGSDFYLEYWTDAETRRRATSDGTAVNFTSVTFIDEFTSAENAQVYALMTLILFVIILIRTITFFLASMRASINMHNRLLISVLKCPISFYDFQPIGILLNRVSRDVGIVDDLLPQNAYEVVESSIVIAGVLVTIVLVDYMNIIPATLLIIISLIVHRVCMKTIIRLKGMEAIRKSHLISHLSTTLSGLNTIRSFKAQKDFIEKFDFSQNQHSSAWFALITFIELLSLSMDAFCVMSITLVILLMTTSIGNNLLDGSKFGLVITSSLMIMGRFQFGITQLIELVNCMTSVKRLQEYCFLTSEAPHDSTPDTKPPPDWPQHGRIVFNNVSLSYIEDERPVLKNLNFEIKQKEKIGIVGRTGAGKSSILAALFRMTEPTGKITIDDIPTNIIGLSDLRRAISIIPQEPILFNGTVRRNLDPFDEYSDQDIWSALECVQLKQVISQLDNGLNGTVSEGAQNFSVGQRQLICLARAILRKSKIIVLDEATANVDPKTDKLIQKIIRDLFESCTVITIAHRLITIMDSDRILVLDNGEVKEFDTPQTLLNIEGGYLATMVKDGDQSEKASV